MSRETIYKNLKPLFFVDEGLVLSGRNKIYLLNTNNQKLQKLFTFNKSIPVNLLNKSRLLYRLFRSGVYSGIGFGENYYFSYRKNLYCFNVKQNNLSKELAFKKGNGPLGFTLITNIKGFNDSLVFGEYFGNFDKEVIKIYSKEKGKRWKIIYSFNKGVINHVHNIIPDPHRNCVWILSGDFGEAASIWQATENFNCVEKAVSGEQIFRSCVAFPLKNGILYATDTQLENNSIRILKEDKHGKWETECLFEINGSCIYGCETADYYVFSTATEPDAKIKNKYYRLLDNQPGPGIIKNCADIIYCSKEDLNFKLLTSNKKDFWPYRLFQFGSIMFPKGKNETNKIYAYNVGSQQNDLSTEIWDLG